MKRFSFVASTCTIQEENKKNEVKGKRWFLFKHNTNWISYSNQWISRAMIHASNKTRQGIGRFVKPRRKYFDVCTLGILLLIPFALCSMHLIDSKDEVFTWICVNFNSSILHWMACQNSRSFSMRSSLKPSVRFDCLLKQDGKSLWTRRTWLEEDFDGVNHVGERDMKLVGK